MIVMAVVNDMDIVDVNCTKVRRYLVWFFNCHVFVSVLVLRNIGPLMSV